MTVLCDQPDCEYQSPTERGISMHKSRTHGLKRKRATGKRTRRAAVDVESDVEEEGGGIEGHLATDPVHRRRVAHDPLHLVHRGRHVRRVGRARAHLRHRSREATADGRPTPQPQAELMMSKTRRDKGRFFAKARKRSGSKRAALQKNTERRAARPESGDSGGDQ